MALGVGLHPSDGFVCFVIDVNLAVSSCGTNGFLACLLQLSWNLQVAGLLIELNDRTDSVLLFDKEMHLS